MASSISGKCSVLSHVQLFATPWTTACQAPLSMGFFRQKYWIGLPFPSPGDLPNPGIEPRSPALQADSLPLSHQGSCAASLPPKISKRLEIQKLHLPLSIDIHIPGVIQVLPTRYTQRRYGKQEGNSSHSFLCYLNLEIWFSSVMLARFHGH